MHREISKCRICGNRDLSPILNLGEQSLTGLFPKSRNDRLTAGPLELVKCLESKANDVCGLVQLRHSYNVGEMYGDNYGYRSGLNSSMVVHLNDVVDKALKLTDLEQDDLIIDIGSNDGTLLNAYPQSRYTYVGIDPTAEKFRKYYRADIIIISDFFSAATVTKTFGKKKAKIVTSIAMFYDLEDPLGFVRNVHDIMDDEGIWVFEQSYMPLMLERNAYDTVCHEHLEYYGLRQVKWLLDRAGMKIVDIEVNDVNGGSFKITAAKARSLKKECSDILRPLHENENIYRNLAPFRLFEKNVRKHRKQLIFFLKRLCRENRTVLGYGASTKGNVILQYCGLTEKEIPYIAEVNEDKFGAFTPKTLIPIISEKEAKAMKPDYFLVLPWHFKENILQREKDTLESGAGFIFPLPDIEIISMEGGLTKTHKITPLS